MTTTKHGKTIIKIDEHEEEDIRYLDNTIELVLVLIRFLLIRVHVSKRKCPYATSHT